MAPYDLSKLRSTYRDPARERMALRAMAHAAEKSLRWRDVCLFVREIIINHIVVNTNKEINAYNIVGDSANENNSTGIATSTELNEEERHFLVQGVKHVVAELRSGCRSLLMVSSSLDQEMKTPGAADQEVQKQHITFQRQIFEDYEIFLEAELQELLNSIIIQVENKLIPNATRPDSRALYFKLAADFYRYLAELRTKAAGVEQKALELYQHALQISSSDLDPTHPIRLGIALNFSVMLYEIVKDRKQACDVAKTAFDQAIVRLDELEESLYTDSTLIMQLIRDNLTIWQGVEGN